MMPVITSAIRPLSTLLSSLVQLAWPYIFVIASKSECGRDQFLDTGFELVRNEVGGQNRVRAARG